MELDNTASKWMDLPLSMLVLNLFRRKSKLPCMLEDFTFQSSADLVFSGHLYAMPEVLIYSMVLYNHNMPKYPF